MYTLLFLLSLPFASEVRSLSSDSFRDREEASASLERSLPWSYAVALTPSGDCETVARKRRLAESPSVVRFAREVLSHGGWFDFIGNWVRCNGDLRWSDNRARESAACVRILHRDHAYSDEVVVYSCYFEFQMGDTTTLIFPGH